MIHRILVGPETVVRDLKKLVRKKLMTGGAVVRIASGSSAQDLELILDAFLPGAEPFGIQDEVLAEVAKHPAATPVLLTRLDHSALPAVRRALAGRSAGQNQRAV